MERINIEQKQSAEFESEEIEAGVELVKAAIGHLDRDVVNCVLMSSLVENYQHHAKQSDEYKHAAEKFGHEPILGGGEIQAKCGPYVVNVKISHDTGSFLKEALAQAVAEGKNPLAALAALLGDDEPCDCPDCRTERGEGPTH